MKTMPELTELTVRKETGDRKEFVNTTERGWWVLYARGDKRDCCLCGRSFHNDNTRSIPHMLGSQSLSRTGLYGWSVWGMTNGHRRYSLCRKWHVYEFTEKVLEEVMDLFPSEYIHIGDMRLPRYDGRIALNVRLRLKPGLKGDQEHTAEEKLQSYVIYVGGFLARQSRKIIVGMKSWRRLSSQFNCNWRGIDGECKAK